MIKQEEKAVHLWTRNFTIITTVNLLIFFGFQMLLPTLPVYVKRLGGGDSIIGLTTGIFSASALVARPFAGRALDRIGRREVFLVGVSIFIISVLTYNWVPTLSLLILFRLIHGLGWGISGTASSTIASDSIPKERFGEGMGYFSLASSLAMATAPAAGLALISKYSFHVLFYMSAGLVVLAFFLSLILKYRKVEKNGCPHDKEPLYERSSFRPTIVITLIAATYGAITSFLPLYAAQKGIQNIGWFFTVYALSLIVARPVFGRINDRLGYNLAIIPGLICILVSMILLSKASALTMFLIAAFTYGTGFGAAQSTLQTMAVAHVPLKRRGAANATFFTGFDIGIGFGAVIWGTISSAVGYSQMYLWTTVPVILSFIAYFLFANQKEIGSVKETYIA